MPLEMYLENSLPTHSLAKEQSFVNSKRKSKSRVTRFIDLFAGMGGTRIGFEAACDANNVKHACVFTSEIKPHALTVYSKNFFDENIAGDITKIDPSQIPEFDFLLGGFPCQPFSAAGKRKGLSDDRGNLFFNIVKILEVKKPLGFLLENVEGLVQDNHGKTLALIVNSLTKLGYHLNWRVLDASSFGVPQRRRRLYIVGHRNKKIDLSNFADISKTVGEVIEQDFPFQPSAFAKLLMKHFSADELHGKAIKDKRGGLDNIHCWDISYKGSTTTAQKKLLGKLLTQRRQKKWAIAKGMDWMDGMPLTEAEIASFFPAKNLGVLLDDLTTKGYLKYEHPKSVVYVNGVKTRMPDPRIEKGYNIVTGKLSFPITKILDPLGHAPTLVATEAGKLAVALPHGVRQLTVREGLRISGFPENYSLESVSYQKAFDLLGNTVMPPVITAVCKRLIA